VEIFIYKGKGPNKGGKGDLGRVLGGYNNDLIGWTIAKRKKLEDSCRHGGVGGVVGGHHNPW